MSHNRQYLYKTLLASLIFSFVTADCLAAAPTLADKEEQDRRARQEAQEKEQRRQGKDVFLQKDDKKSEDTSLPEEATSFKINTILLEGEKTERFPWTKAMLDKYTGRKIGVEGINLIVKRLSNAFIERGYITTRVVVPEQDLSQGVLRLTLVPGIIGDIRFQDPKAKGDWQTAYPCRPGDILNLRELEQGLEQLKRVPSQDADMKLLPGAKPGETIVEITLKRSKSLKVSLSLDDSGFKATGKLQASETIALDNLFGINDLFNISFNSDAEREGQALGTRGDGIYYSFPYGNSTFTFSRSSYNYHQTISSGGTSFISSGKSSSTEFKVSQLLHRDQTSKTHLDFGFVKGESKSYLADVELEVQRKNTTAAKLGLSHRKYSGQTTIDLQLGYKQGVPWLGCQREKADRDPGLPTVYYKLWTLDASLSTPVQLGKTKASYSINLRGQYTDDLLYGSDFFSIGGRYTVRGFDGEETLSAEKGWYVRNELSVPLGSGGPEAYIGLDYGQVMGPSAPSATDDGILIGTVLGLRGALGKAQYDVFIGRPLKKPDTIVTAKHTYGFQIICSL